MQGEALTTTAGKSMTSYRDTLRSFTDAAADAVAREIATLRLETKRERELRDAQFAARVAKLEVQISAVTELERRLAERLTTLKDGEPGKSVTVEDVTPVLAGMVRDAVASLPPPEPGRSVTVEDVDPLISSRVAEAVASIPLVDAKAVDPEMVREMIDVAVAALPPPQPGKDADPEEIARMVSDAVRAAVDALPPPERGEPGPMGALPVVLEWEDRVYYEGNIVSFAGGLYQARRDTGKAPEHDDWTCIVRAGRDGKDGRNGEDGRSFTVRGTWSADGDYRHLDVVALNGAAFVARRDAPGTCPGDGWQMIASQGKQGKPGARGETGKGVQGDPGMPVVAMHFDGGGMLTLVNGDGSTVECDLYPVLSKLSR